MNLYSFIPCLSILPILIWIGQVGLGSANSDIAYPIDLTTANT